MARNVASPTQKQVKADFQSFWNSTGKERLEDQAKQKPLFVSAHKYAICISQLSRALSGYEEHRRIFLQELASDAVHLVHALSGGDARGARFYLRSVIENFWRHHYFRDHVVEYGWLHTRNKYYVEMKSLREHCAWLDCFKDDLKPKYDDLTRMYASLSSAVHSTSSRTLILRDTLKDIKLTDAQASEMSKDLHGVFKPCLMLCIFSESATFRGIHVNMQEFILGVLSKSQKKWIEENLPA